MRPRFAGFLMLVLMGLTSVGSAAEPETDKHIILRLEAEIRVHKATIRRLAKEIDDLKKENQRLSREKAGSAAPVAVAPSAPVKVALNDQEKDYLASSIAQRAIVIVDLEKDITDQKKRLRTLSRAIVTRHEGKSAYTGKQYIRRGRFESQAAKTKAVNQIRKRLRSLSLEKKKWENPSNHYTPIIMQFQAGAIGALSRDDSTLRIIQILGPSEMIVAIGRTSVLVKGLSTAGLTDDSRVTLAEVLLINGTYTYTTVMGGSKTILKAEPFNDSRVQAYALSHPEEMKKRIAEAVSVGKKSADPSARR